MANLQIAFALCIVNRVYISGGLAMEAVAIARGRNHQHEYFNHSSESHGADGSTCFSKFPHALTPLSLAHLHAPLCIL